ncbi:putative (gmc) oxidoreductase [Lyophyllum shimeji]|uniref:(Gmc) oxidoreductase n=1 Tax=Lyophyllum shimeji TaxID=47721 RepID=A0A9P3Q004_LYOSH|nr:putative (gmc) oxidoreductase [Lyophyllum shimeji]
MNFYAWTRPPAADVDAWEKLGNPGWNWADYLRYSKKVETFHPPAEEQTDRFPHTYDADIRGTSGPIHVTIPPHVHTVDALVQQTLVNMGIRVIEDPYQGNISGTWIGSANLDPKTWTRSYSATAYLSPSQNRPNLTVLLGALASRIIFADESDNLGLTATGLEFIHQGNRYVVNAQKEVILSVGVPKSSQILELSGVGRAEVLSRIGVEPKIKLPGVGENLQEHEFLAVSYELNPATKHETLDLLRESEYAGEASQLHAEGKGRMRTGITSFTYIPLSSVKTPGAAKLVQKMEREIEEWKNEPGILHGLQKQLEIQLATLRDDSLPDFEIVAFPGLFSTTATPGPGKSYTSFMGFLNHPLSRGTVHATTNDPEDNPEINPHYFEKDSDLELMVQTFKYIRRMVHTEPLKSGIVQTEVEPGPHCTTDEHIRDFIKNTHHTVWHGVGTCSMLPRDEQGVVDPSLKVYGTTNVRVVDLSVVPLHIAAHAHSTAYVIAEKAAHIISSAHEPVL